MTTYIKFIIRYRFAVLTFILLVTVGFGMIATRGVIASSIGNLFFGDDHPEYQRYRKRIRQFANDEVFIVTYEGNDILAPETMQRLETVIEKIGRIADVGRVDSILNAQHIFAEGDTLFVQKYGEEVLAHPDRKDNFLSTLRSDRLTAGLIVSESEPQLGIVVELLPDDNRAIERGPLVVGEVFNIFTEAGFDPARLRRVGLLVTLSEVVEQTRFNFYRLFPAVCIALLLVLYLIFHRFWPVFITFAVSLMAVIWTLGFAVLLDRHISIFLALSPAVILIVTTSDVIHLCSAYMLELSAGKPKPLAILRSGHEVGTACLMTSITTFIGFVSLSLVPVPAFKQMGLVLGFGVAVALLLAMTLSPILFWMLKAPKPWNDNVSKAQSLLSRCITAIREIGIYKPWFAVIGFAIVGVISIYGLSRLTIETDLIKRLDEKNPIRIDETHFRQSFAGSNFLDVFVDTLQKGGVLDPDMYSRLKIFQRKLEALPEVDKVVSLVDLMTIIDREMNPDRDEERAEWNRQLLAQYLLLFEMSGGEDLDRLLDFDRRTLRMAVRLDDNRVRATYDTGQRVKIIAQSVFGNSAHVQATGLNYLMGMFLDDIIIGQRMGMMAAFLLILLLMIFWMRSIRIGLWSMIPNLLPIAAMGGCLGLFWDEVDSDTITIAIIAIGIGVDDTIHFLVRLRFEARRAADTATALKRTFHFSGRAIIITTVILVAGFLPFVLSEYFSIWIMGVFLPMALIVALLADLFLVPALVTLGVIRFETHTRYAKPDAVTDAD